MTVALDTRELDRLESRIKSVLEIAVKPQLLLMQLAKGVIEQHQARLEYEKTSPSGDKWPDWSPAYAATRDSGDSLLIDSREMFDDFHFKVNRTGFAMWNESPYAAAQNFGRPEINLPAREFMGLSDDNVRNIDSWLASVLLGGVKGAKVRQTTRKKIKGGKGRKR